MRVPKTVSTGMIPARAEPVPVQKEMPPQKQLWVAYALHLMGGGGFLGLHRFYLGFTRSARIQLALGATCLLLPLVLRIHQFQMFLMAPTMLWYVVDLFLIPRMAREVNTAARFGRGTSSPGLEKGNGPA